MKPSKWKLACWKSWSLGQTWDYFTLGSTWKYLPRSQRWLSWKIWREFFWAKSEFLICKRAFMLQILRTKVPVRVWLCSGSQIWQIMFTIMRQWAEKFLFGHLRTLVRIDLSNFAIWNQVKSFIFVATTQYAFATIPRDPVSGRRVWRNNKASASFNGFINDQTVKGTGIILQNYIENINKIRLRIFFMNFCIRNEIKSLPKHYLFLNLALEVMLFLTINRWTMISRVLIRGLIF